MAKRARRGASAALKKKAKATKRAPQLPTTPASVTLAGPFSFYGAAGSFHRWGAGEVVTDPVQIAMLLERRAPLQDNTWDDARKTA